MKKFSRTLVIFACLAFTGSLYYASVSGFGIGRIDNQHTRSEIEQNCPGYYQSPNGDCLGRTFRSYYMVRGIRGGGFGGGK